MRATLIEDHLRAANRCSSTLKRFLIKLINLSILFLKNSFSVLYYLFKTTHLRSHCGCFLAICQLCFKFLFWKILNINWILPWYSFSSASGNQSNSKKGRGKRDEIFLFTFFRRIAIFTASGYLFLLLVLLFATVIIGSRGNIFQARSVNGKIFPENFELLLIAKIAIWVVLSYLRTYHNCSDVNMMQTEEFWKCSSQYNKLLKTNRDQRVQKTVF